MEIPGATDPFWAEVVSGEGEEEEAVYTVRDEKGQDHVVQRQYLRERKWGTVAFSGVTPDTKHDTYASQCFLKKTLQWWEDNYVNTGKENINSVHIHSDNASHFKSRKSMHFLSQIKVLFAWVSWVTWSFGCPGHGKGPWDGFGGMLKRVMRRAIIDGGVVMRNGKDVYEFLVKRFCTEEWTRSHSDYTINQIVVQYAEQAEMNDARPKHEKDYEAIHGIQKSFGYMGLREDIVLQREWDCWCRGCFKAAGIVGDKEDNLDSNYQCKNCVLGKKQKWFESSVGRSDAAGVAAARGVRQAEGKETALKLKAGDFVVVQDREDQSWTVPFMIGQICDTGEGCVRTFTERETIERRRFDAGDTAITVRWYDIHLLTNIESILILRVWVAVQAKARSAGSAKANFRATAS